MGFLDEVQALGFSISSVPVEGAEPYIVIGGRSNARWWLIPLSNRHVAASGLALFQPIIASAKMLKTVATTLSALGLAPLWAKNRVYVKCPPVFADLFNCAQPSYAFFTGTDSPHRKTAIQVMTPEGEIKGFAKVSCVEEVKQLIVRETDCIEYIRSLQLKSARVPKVLLSAEQSGARLLVTDTEKIRHSRSPTMFTPQHQAFLSELAAKSCRGGASSCSQFLQGLRQQTVQFTARLSTEWNRRLEAAFNRIADCSSEIRAKTTFCHGDFTPWNTFMVGAKLYVFDWEYARHCSPPGYDLIHFTLSLPEVARRSVAEIIGRVRQVLQEYGHAADSGLADIFLLCYLCGHSLHYIAREPLRSTKLITWDSEPERGVLIDALLASGKL